MHDAVVAFFCEYRFHEKELGELTISTLQVELRFYACIKTFYERVNQFNSIDFSLFAFSKSATGSLWVIYLSLKGCE